MGAGALLGALCGSQRQGQSLSVCFKAIIPAFLLLNQFLGWSLADDLQRGL